jgi:hypothetical protein
MDYNNDDNPEKVFRGFIIAIGIGALLWVGIAVGITLLVRSCSEPAKPMKVENAEVEANPLPLIDSRLDLLPSDESRLAVVECGKTLSQYTPDPIGFVLTIACVESDFGRNVEGSPDGEIGIMQIHPVWLRESRLTHWELKHDYMNVCFAVALLDYYFKKYGDLFKVLTAYNMGEGRVNHKNTKYLNRFFDCAERVGWQSIVEGYK